jgi:hypothetical protein
MRTSLVAVGCLIGCGNPSAFHPAKLPDLVVSQASIKQLVPRELLFVPGEHLVWDVHLHGMTIGRAELEVGDTPNSPGIEIRSRFKTDSLASMVMTVSHELSTIVPRGTARPGSSSELFASNTENHHYEATFDGAMLTLNGIPTPVPGGNFGQTMHTAIGALRSWATPDANPGFVVVVAMGQLYRLDVMRPTLEDLQGTKTLRIDGRIRAKQPINLVMWLAETPDRTPLRIELSDEDFHITAELVRS